MKFLTIFIYLFYFSAKLVSPLIDCDNVLTDTYEFTGLCSNKWKNLQPLLRPGQSVVGYAWVRRKLDKNFGSEDDAQDYIDDSSIIGVINPGIDGSPLITIVDQHHTLCALDYSGYQDVSVPVNIICDYRNLTWAEFYDTMIDQNLLYLAGSLDGYRNNLPEPIGPESLPNYFQFTEDNKVFQDDPWRALSSFSRKVEDPPDGFPSCGSDDYKYCERCYIRLCEPSETDSNPPTIPFYEFRWGYFMNYASFYNNSYWPTFSEWQKFLKAYFELETEFEKIDYDDWQDAADKLISLCRNGPTGYFELPEDIFGNAQSRYLPGFVEGPVKLDEDPTCGLPECSYLHNLGSSNFATF